MCASETSTRSCQSAIVSGSPLCSATTRRRALSANAGSASKRSLASRYRVPSASKSFRCDVPVSSMCWVSIPNCVPQSPRWFMRMTLVALELEHAHERVADHGRAQVADVHLLGHVGRGVVDGDDLRDGRRRHAEPLVLERLGRPARERLAGEREVDEPGPGDLDRRQRAAGVAERPDHALGQAARAARRAAWPASWRSSPAGRTPAGAPGSPAGRRRSVRSHARSPPRGRTRAHGWAPRSHL